MRKHWWIVCLVMLLMLGLAALLHHETPSEDRLQQLPVAQTRSEGYVADHKSHAIGFFVNWDDASMSSLKRNLDSLDMIIAEWLHLAGENGSLRENDSNRQAQATDFIRAHHPDLPIIPLVNNWNGREWDGIKLGHMLADITARTRAIEQLAAYAEKHHFAGICIDFENIAAKDRSNFQRFIAELYATFHPKKLLVSVTVPANDSTFPYRDLARNADELILMIYDEHWSTGSPGPIASLPWFTEVLNQRQLDIPAEKMIVAIGNYTYDWEMGHPAETRTFEEVVLIAKKSESNIHLDPASFNPTFDYIDDNNHLHQVWMQDTVTAFNQLATIYPIQPYGVALWRLGGEDPAIWQIFGKEGAPDTARVDQLAHYIARQKPVSRSFKFDPKLKLITEERVGPKNDSI